MAGKTITSANSKFTIIVPDAGLGPFTLNGYAADAAFATEAVEVGVKVIGVDGLASTGFVPSLTPLNVTLQANSESNTFFETWLAAQKLAREAFVGKATIDIPSIGKSYVVNDLSLISVQQIPGAARTLQPIVYNMMAADVQVLPLVQAA